MHYITVSSSNFFQIWGNFYFLTISTLLVFLFKHTAPSQLQTMAHNLITTSVIALNKEVKHWNFHSFIQFLFISLLQKSQKLEKSNKFRRRCWWLKQAVWVAERLTEQQIESVNQVQKLNGTVCIHLALMTWRKGMNPLQVWANEYGS